MAKNYQDIYNSVYVTGNKMDWTNAMIRGNGIPLDIYSVFDSYEDAVIFAATNAVAYEGQVLAVTENGDTTVYVITPALQGTVVIDEVVTNIYLKEVGTATLGDDKSIVLSDEGILSLKNFGVEYYAYTETEGEDGETVASYVKTTGWKDGLTPKVVKVVDEDGNESFEIAWYEPSATTVEGLSDKIATLETKVDEFDETKANKATTIAGYGITDAYTKTEVDDLLDDKAGKATTLEGYGITDAYTKAEVYNKEEIDGKLSGLFHFKGEVNYYNELIAIENPLEGDVYVVKYAGTEGSVALGAEYVYDGENWVEFGSLVDLSGYATKAELSDVDDKANDNAEAIESNTEAIAAINNESTGILAQAKAYTDDEVAENKQLIDAINNESTGILAQAKKYTDDELSEHEEAATTAIATAKSEAITEATTIANSYTDGKVAENKELIDANADEIEALKTANITNLEEAKTYAKDYADGLNSAMDARVKANTEAIDVINGENGILANAKAYTDSQLEAHEESATQAIADAKSGAVSDAKDYTDAREVEINKGVAANAEAISAINNESTGILVNAKAYTDEQLNSHKTEAETAISTAKSEAISAANEYTDGKVTVINGELETLKQADITTLADAKAYTDQKVVSEIAASNAMIYRGTVGIGGTVETLPTTEVKNGDTYKVFVAGTYNGVEAREGDMFIAVVTTGETISIEWTYIPSGDDGNIYKGTTYEVNAIVAAKENGTVETIDSGEAGQILKSSGEGSLPVWTKEKEYTVESETEGLYIEKTVDENEDISYKVTLNSVSTDILTQGALTLVLNGGNASGVIASE